MPDSCSGVHSISVLSIDADSKAIGCEKVPSSKSKAMFKILRANLILRYIERQITPMHFFLAFYWLGAHHVTCK